MMWSVKPGEWQEVGLVIFNREHTPWNWFADWNQKETKRWRGEMCRKEGHEILLVYPLYL